MIFTETRHQLHRHAELSGNESKTASIITEKLTALGVSQIHSSFAGCSVLAEIKGIHEGPSVMFRCELDALPISETNRFDYVSLDQNTSHLCGHDGHMAIMLRLASMLIQNPPQRGSVLLLFQSAEETGEGAAAVMKSEILNAFDLRFVFALHNVPGFPLHSVVCRTGAFSAAVESVVIKLQGKSCHAAEPEKGINPAQAIASTIRYMESLNCSDKNSEHYFYATPVQISMDSASFGTSAGDGVVAYTLRAQQNELFDKRKKEISETIPTLASQTLGLKCELEWFEPFTATVNAPEAVNEIRQAANANGFQFIEKTEPFAWGEDFGEFTRHFSGAMFGLGAGENSPALHHSDYDFDDELIESGAKMYFSLVSQILKNN